MLLPLVVQAALKRACDRLPAWVRLPVALSTSASPTVPPSAKTKIRAWRLSTTMAA